MVDTSIIRHIDQSFPFFFLSSVICRIPACPGADSGADSNPHRFPKQRNSLHLKRNLLCEVYDRNRIRSGRSGEDSRTLRSLLQDCQFPDIQPVHLHQTDKRNHTKKEQRNRQRRFYGQASAGNKERDSFTARQNIFSSGGKGRNCRFGCV